MQIDERRAKGRRLDRPTTLTAGVVSYIRDAVIRGEFGPETPLPEARLAQELGTSRITVRVALRALKDLGLVEIIPHRGAFVSTLTPRKAREIFGLRALLESYAVRLALRNGPLPQVEIDKLRAALDGIDKAASHGDPMGVIKAVMRFHWLIALQSDHELLLSQLENLQPQIRRFIFYTKLYESDPMSELESHAQLLDAIKSGDPDLFERVVFEHHASSGERLVQRMVELAAEQTGADSRLRGTQPQLRT